MSKYYNQAPPPNYNQPSAPNYNQPPQQGYYQQPPQQQAPKDDHRTRNYMCWWCTWFWQSVIMTLCVNAFFQLVCNAC